MALLLTCVALPQARADFVQIGSTYTVDNTNFVDTFTQNVTFDGTGVNKSIDSGQLQINEQVFPTGQNGAWIQFNFSTTQGGPLASDATALWETQLENLAFAQPLIYDGFFVYFSHNGTPFSNIEAGDFDDVETNPVTGSGEVLGINVTPAGPFTSIGLFAFISPYDRLDTNYNIDSAAANGFSLAFHVDLANPVPEPGTLTLLGAGVGSLSLGIWRRRKPPAAAF